MLLQSKSFYCHCSVLNPTSFIKFFDLIFDILSSALLLFMFQISAPKHDLTFFNVLNDILAICVFSLNSMTFKQLSHLTHFQCFMHYQKGKSFVTIPEYLTKEKKNTTPGFNRIDSLSKFNFRLKIQSNVRKLEALCCGIQHLILKSRLLAIGMRSNNECESSTSAQNFHMNYNCNAAIFVFCFV